MLFKKLAELANTLDDMGYTEAADEVDGILKDSGLSDIFLTKKCTCPCAECDYAKTMGPRIGSQDHHNKCTEDKCELKVK